MKKYYFLAIFIWLSYFVYGQKKISPIPIEGTRILISASAEEINRVKVKFEIDGEGSENLFSDKNEFLVTPFNELNFKIELKKFFRKYLRSTTENEEEIKSQFLKLFDEKTDLKRYVEGLVEKKVKEGKIEEGKAKSKDGDIAKYKSYKVFNERISSLYNYIQGQLILIFKYDIEPEAGVLSYNNQLVPIQWLGKRGEDFYRKEAIKLNNVFRKYNKSVKGQTKKLLKDNSIDKNSLKNNSKIEDSIKMRIAIETNGLIEFNDFENYSLNSFYNAFRTDSRANRLSFFIDFLLKKENENKKLEKLELEISKLETLREETEKENEKINSAEYIQISLDSLIQLEKEKSKVKKTIENIDKMMTPDLNKIKNEQVLLVEKLREEKIVGSSVWYTDLFNKRDQVTGLYIKPTLELKKIVKENGKEAELNVVENLIKKYSNNYQNKIKKSFNEKSYMLVDEDIEIINNKIESIKEKKNIDLGDKNYNEYREEQILQIKNSKDSISVFKKDKNEIVYNIKKLINKTITSLFLFKPHKIQLDFNDGFIEHIVIDGSIEKPILKDSLMQILKRNGIKDFDLIEKKQLKFTNDYPLGFSAKNDFNDFDNEKIYSYAGSNRIYRMKIKDVILLYVQTAKNDRLDFSPKDQSITIYPDYKEEYENIELKKEKSSKLFNLSIYSDFIGLKESDPNGLLQLEGNKLMPLNTTRHLVKGSFSRLFDRSLNYGAFNYINPQIRWSRLSTSDNSENLILTYLRSLNGNEEERLPYVTQLDLLRHENFSIGADLNVLSIGLPNYKIRLEVNASGRFGRTQVIDTNGLPLTSTNEKNEIKSNIVRDFQVNTWRFYPELIFRLRPEERYGATLAFRTMYFDTRTTDFSNVSSERDFTTTLTDSAQWLHQLAIDAHFSPSGKLDDRFFFRYRLTNNARWEYNGFSEIQVGYTVSLKF